MKIHEYQAKEILAQYGVPTQHGIIATTPEDARKAAEEIGGMIVVKAQVHVGGRGKAGGVKLAKSPAEAQEWATKILGMSIKGITVKKVLITQAAEIKKEFYLGVVLDRARKTFTIMASAEGGVEIEEVAKTNPEKILQVHADPYLGLCDYQSRELAFGLGLDPVLVGQFNKIATTLYKIALAKDANLVEINPLVINGEGNLQALDAKIVFDDNALFRHPDIEKLRDINEEEETEVTARAAGLTFIKLDGNIGCVVNGAGLAMATMDSIKLYGGEPANFLDIGGGAKADKVDAALRLILADTQVKAILFNIFGGITRCDDVARGIIQALAEVKTEVPIVVRLVGTNEAEGKRLLADANLIPASTMAEAAKKVVEVAKKR